MHGGKSIGAPIGKSNGNYKHGRNTQQRLNERKELKELCRKALEDTKQTNQLLRQFKHQARNLGVRWQKLWQLCCQDDNGKELLLFIAKRLQKIEMK